MTTNLGWFKLKKFVLLALEARSLVSRCGQGCTPLKLQGPSLSRPVSGGCRCSLACSCVSQPHVCVTPHLRHPVPACSGTPRIFTHPRLHHPWVCVTPASASPLVCAHPASASLPRVCLHPTWPPLSRHLCVLPHPRLRVPGTGFRSHLKNGGPHLHLISSAKTLFPKVSLEVSGGCDFGEYC